MGTSFEMDTPQQQEAHKRKPNYLAVFWGLAALTALEVGITFLPIPRAPILAILTTSKVALVALYYMHLRTDSRLFSAIFLIPVPLALLVTIAVVINQQHWWQGFLAWCGF